MFQVLVAVLDADGRNVDGEEVRLCVADGKQGLEGFAWHRSGLNEAATQHSAHEYWPCVTRLFGNCRSVCVCFPEYCMSS